MTTLIVLAAALLILIIVGAGLIIYRLITSIEAYEEELENTYTVFEEVRRLSLDTQANLKELDIRGAFEADDEVGVTFKNIKQISDELTEFITEFKTTSRWK